MPSKARTFSGSFGVSLIPKLKRTAKVQIQGSLRCGGKSAAFGRDDEIVGTRACFLRCGGKSAAFGRDDEIVGTRACFLRCGGKSAAFGRDDEIVGTELA